MSGKNQRDPPAILIPVIHTTLSPLHMKQPYHVVHASEALYLACPPPPNSPFLTIFYVVYLLFITSRS